MQKLSNGLEFAPLRMVCIGKSKTTRNKIPRCHAKSLSVVTLLIILNLDTQSERAFFLLQSQTSKSTLVPDLKKACISHIPSNKDIAIQIRNAYERVFVSRFQATLPLPDDCVQSKSPLRRRFSNPENKPSRPKYPLRNTKTFVHQNRRLPSSTLGDRKKAPLYGKKRMNSFR